MTEWKPINTAPKDGRHLLLFTPETDAKEPLVIVGWILSDGVVRTFDQPYGVNDFRYHPITHWMPLPEPPNE